MSLNLSVLEDYWASIGGQTHKRVSEEQVEDLAGVQKPLIQIAQEQKKKFFGHVMRHPSELDWLTPSCMDELLETEGVVDHGDVG